MDKFMTEILLSDEFCQFAKQINEIHEQKKQMKDEYKKMLGFDPKGI